MPETVSPPPARSTAGRGRGHGRRATLPTRYGPGRAAGSRRCTPRRGPALLDERRLIHHQHSVRAPEPVNHVRPQVIADSVGIPTRRVKVPLFGTRQVMAHDITHKVAVDRTCAIMSNSGERFRDDHVRRGHKCSFLAAVTWFDDSTGGDDLTRAIMGSAINEVVKSAHETAPTLGFLPGDLRVPVE